jgi:RNA polymerase sigma-70 factor (ECF subfamily)
LDITDAELVKRCLADDHGAWEIIVRRYHPRIYNLAYRFTGRFDESEDLTQEIFLKVFRSLSSYKPESGALVTWMVRVGRNHLIDHYRKFKIERAQTIESETVTESPAGSFSSPVDDLEKRELSERVHRALLKVPEDLREAVILRDLEEFTYEEIADVLKLPLGTVKSRINRGRIELARLLKRTS